jgi:hypothetical protein
MDSLHAALRIPRTRLGADRRTPLPQNIFCPPMRAGNTEDRRKSCGATTRLPGVKAVAPAPIVHQCSVSDLQNIVIMTLLIHVFWTA